MNYIDATNSEIEKPRTKNRDRKEKIEKNNHRWI